MMPSESKTVTFRPRLPQSSLMSIHATSPSSQIGAIVFFMTEVFLVLGSLSGFPVVKSTSSATAKGSEVPPLSPAANSRASATFTQTIDPGLLMSVSGMAGLVRDATAAPGPSLTKLLGATWTLKLTSPNFHSTGIFSVRSNSFQTAAAGMISSPWVPGMKSVSGKVTAPREAPPLAPTTLTRTPKLEQDSSMLLQTISPSLQTGESVSNTGLVFIILVFFKGFPLFTSTISAVA
mmetsp:Transcript_44311/g.100154  ORF Transcript_44311/g.100154 Transcript_44311/m.100154 type:complete len:235 (-) Transcript_44311:162-866(-)